MLDITYVSISMHVQALRKDVHAHMLYMQGCVLMNMDMCSNLSLPVHRYYIQALHIYGWGSQCFVPPPQRWYGSQGFVPRPPPQGWYGSHEMLPSGVRQRKGCCSKVPRSMAKWAASGALRPMGPMGPMGPSGKSGHGP